MTALFTLISVQAVLGAIDNLWHHEITERLPAKRAAAPELALHAARECLYAFLFIALAWFEWHGAWAALIALVLVTEVGVTLADFIVEDRTRNLPPFERVLHTVLAVTFGAVVALLAPHLLQWWAQPSAIVPAFYGAFSWLFTAFAAGVFAWSVRNATAVLRHRRPPEWVREPIAAGTRDAPATVLVTGGTGFIGGQLVRRLVARGDRVTVLTRDADKARDRFGPHVRVVTDLQDVSSPVDAVVNLAGAPILGMPWTNGRRRKLLDSRLATTRAIGALCARLPRPPAVVVSASAIGYYGVRGDEPVDEQGDSQPIFQSQLCREWEEEACRLESEQTRVVRLRFGLVLGGDGGALPQLARPVSMGIGAVIGSGRQWVSWIHIEDLVAMIERALDDPGWRGVFNGVAPEPVTHHRMQRALARTLRRPLWLRLPGFVLRAGLGEMAQLLVDGQRVVPAHALAAGFTFRHSRVQDALDHLLRGAVKSDDVPLGEIYYNGECPVCRAEMRRYSKVCADASISLQFVDATRQDGILAAYGLGREHLWRRLYLRDTRGRLLSGLPAMIELWSRMPGYRWLSALLRWPLLRRPSEAVYDLVIAPALAFWARRRMRARRGDEGFADRTL